MFHGPNLPEHISTKISIGYNEADLNFLKSNGFIQIQKKLKIKPLRQTEEDIIKIDTSNEIFKDKQHRQYF